MSPPLAFVTGSTGFLGRHVTRQLKEQGWRTVRLVRRLGADGPDDEERLGDITDPDSLLRAIPEGCDAVFHIAADIRHWRGADAEQNLINVGGTRHVVRAALAKGARRLIHCSSDAVWGLQTPMLREDVPRRGVEEPVNYHRSKFWAEEEVRCGLDQGLDAVMVNPTNILGPGDRHGWSMFAVAIHRGHVIAAPPGAGAFVHVEDVAAAMIAAADRGRCGHNYLLGGVNASYLAFAKACAEQLALPFPDRPRSASAVLREARGLEAEAAALGRAPRLSLDTARVLCASLEVDSGKAVRELGFQIRPLSVLVEQTIAALREAGHIPA
jgi:nucleoside-diphosphate-sugar epimerase